MLSTWYGETQSYLSPLSAVTGIHCVRFTMKDTIQTAGLVAAYLNIRGFFLSADYFTVNSS